MAAKKAWLCVVCGYVHYGDEPPEACPICGAGRAEFQPHAESSPEETKGKEWVCIICGCEHFGGAPPDLCPVCSAGRDEFEPARRESGPAALARRERIVIAGAGIAGLSAAEAIRRAAPDFEITLLSQERHLPYYRLNLTRYLAGEIGDADLPIHPRDWYESERIDLREGTEVAALALDDRSVQVGGEKIPYDRLILATGARCWIPPFPGSEKDGVFSVRSCDDARAILDRLRAGMKCLCVGGGILGIETAGALARRGVEATLIESFPWLMPRQLNQRAAAILESHLAGLGIRLRTSARIRQILGDDRATGISFEDGSKMPADMIVVNTGIRPNLELARSAGLEVKSGILVNDRLETSRPGVFAAGDVAEHRGVLYGLWAPAQYQGSLAGLNAAGRNSEFGGIPRLNTLKVLGIKLFSIGQFEAADGSHSALAGESGGNFAHFLLRDNRMIGAILLGDTSASAAAKKAIESGADLSSLLRGGPSAVRFMECLRESIREA